MINKCEEREIIYVVWGKVYVYGQRREDNCTNKWKFIKFEENSQNPKSQHTELDSH